MATTLSACCGNLARFRSPAVQATAHQNHGAPAQLHFAAPRYLLACLSSQSNSGRKT